HPYHRVAAVAQNRGRSSPSIHQEVMTEQLPMDIPPRAHAKVTNESQHVVIQFRVHGGGQFSLNPR
ncbi:unnamed protein product, partial [Urochloa humidicola]